MLCILIEGEGKNYPVLLFSGHGHPIIVRFVSRAQKQALFEYTFDRGIQKKKKEKLCTYFCWQTCSPCTRIIQEYNTVGENNCRRLTGKFLEKRLNPIEK